MVSDAAAPLSGAALISNVSRPSALPIDEDSAPASWPAASACGALRQRHLLPFAERVDRLVEDDQRQDVGLLERRRAAQDDVRLLQRAAHVDARLDALNQPPRADVEQSG